MLTLTIAIVSAVNGVAVARAGTRALKRGGAMGFLLVWQYRGPWPNLCCLAAGHPCVPSASGHAAHCTGRLPMLVLSVLICVSIHRYNGM